METRKARHHNPNQKDKKIMNNVVNTLLARSRHPRCKTEPLNRHTTDDLYNQSALAIGSYYTSHAMRQTQLLAIALDGKPILTLGYPDNDDTQREADTLLNLPSFARIAHEFFGAGELTKVVVKGDAVMGGNTPYSCIVFGEQGKTYEVDDNGEIKQANDKLASAKRTSTSRRPHIRSAHYHGYWMGTGQDKHYTLKWIAPIFVNG
jgi:hypothetical protein